MLHAGHAGVLVPAVSSWLQPIRAQRWRKIAYSFSIIFVDYFCRNFAAVLVGDRFLMNLRRIASS
ncbi:hypothetical protein [Rhizobium sp. AN80A]|uniref:hypothetical protein n=1 Tax=Rhizobium sp. AN80A TaxID=3040673 RepID=UPI0024B3425A|nr:hypothetical protein [Rhizobium sp. AN80A]